MISPSELRGRARLRAAATTRRASGEAWALPAAWRRVAAILMSGKR
jgi:hypothetical protein